MLTKKVSFDYDVTTTATFHGSLSLDEGSGRVAVHDDDRNVDVGDFDPVYADPPGYGISDLAAIFQSGAVYAEAQSDGLALKGPAGGFPDQLVAVLPIRL